MSFRPILVAFPCSLMLAIALTACGGSSPSTGTSHSAAPSSGSTPSTASTPPTSRRTTASTTQATATTPLKGKRAALHPHGKSKLRATVYTPPKPSAATTTAVRLSPPSAQDPCTLVRRSEAQKALKAPVTREINAPLGPTCVIVVQGQKQSVTVAVQSMNVAARVAQMSKKPSRLAVAGRTTFCGTLGTSILFVELNGGRALQIVGAPCGEATALAANAVPRIRS